MAIPKQQQKPKSKTKTRWEALYQAKLWPKEIRCEGYYPVHLANVTCHSRVIPSVKNIQHHMQTCSDDVGASFIMKMETRSEGCPLWRELEDAGIEALDFRCAVDSHVVPFHPIHIAKHTRPHSGNKRRVTEGNIFQFTLSYEPPIEEEIDSY